MSPTGLAGGDQDSRYSRGGRVVEGVVAGAVAVGADRGTVLYSAIGPVPGDEHLVTLGAAVGVRDVEQHQVEVVAERGGRRLPDGLQGPAGPRTSVAGASNTPCCIYWLRRLARARRTLQTWERWADSLVRVVVDAEHVRRYGVGLAGEVAHVTGGRGHRLSIARTFAADSARVMITARREDSLQDRGRSVGRSW